MSKNRFETYKEVFDYSTEKTIYKLANDGYIDLLIGIISTGKEGNVFLAKNHLGKEVAVKIYRIETSSFQNMWKYINGDRRFENIKKTKKSIVNVWAQKEFKNLKLAEKAGLNVPKPIISRNNILIMDFIGENEKSAPIAKNYPPRNPKKWLKKVLNMINDLYQKVGLIHGDLSEYNILNYKEEPYFIDFGQGVLKDHPIAEELLKKDIKNISKWFKKQNVNVKEPEKIYKEIIKDD